MALGKSAIVALAAVAGVSAQAQQGPSLEEFRKLLEPYASTNDVVTLADGREVGFTCMGEGSPTVILIPGLGDFAGISWGGVQPQMARTTRVCSWDRPGWGLSDGAPGKHTIASNVATLEAALDTGKVSGPYVVVGHSFGGLEALLLADHRPQSVAGMVLVDPSVPDQSNLMARVAPAMAAENERQIAGAPFAKCAKAIRNGSAKAGGPDPDQCFAYPPFFPPELGAAFAAKVANPVQYETVVSFFGNVKESTEQAVNPDRDYRDMPLVVLTATTMGPTPPDISAEALEQMQQFQEIFSRAHDDLAALSSRGINARVPAASHYIQRDKPRVVIDAVAAVVAEARAAAGD